MDDNANIVLKSFRLVLSDDVTTINKPRSSSILNNADIRKPEDAMPTNAIEVIGVHHSYTVNEPILRGLNMR